MNNERPLFIPLKREFFRAFEARTKDTEFRLYGPRWNERTCRVGRQVTLALGYGFPRLRGRVVGFEQRSDVAAIPGWLECYGPVTPGPAACIKISLE